MKRYQVHLALQAEIDLLNLEDYISCELLAPVSAASTLHAIERKINSLEFAPERGRKYELEGALSRDIRTVHIKNFVVIFEIEKTKRRVNILHVSYARREIEAIIKNI